MDDRDGNCSELREEIAALKRKIGDLERSEAERREAEERWNHEIKDLRRSEKIYRSVIENIRDVFYRSDAGGRLLMGSPSGAGMFGYESVDEMIGLPLDSFWPDRKGRERLIEEIRTKGFVQDFEAVLKRQDGSTFDASLTTHFYYDEEGRFQGTEGIIRDITERKRAEALVRESGKKIKSIFLAAPVGIGLVSLSDRMILEANDRLCEMTGYSREELLGQNARLLYLTEEDYEHVGRERDRQIPTQGTATVETRWRRKDGEAVDVLLNSTLFDAADPPAGVTFIALDITLRKQLETRLLQAQKMEAIGTLAGGIAHDFNNLLMGIQGHASLALMDLDPSHPNYERLERIEEHVKSGADLTRQLLGYAQGGRYETKSTNIGELLKKTSSMFGRTKKEIAIYQKDGRDLWNVEVDRGQMEQVLMNLYVNAWQAMPGGGEIYLETENVPMDKHLAASHGIAAGPYVRIAVTDTGTGMDARTKERIFDPFFTTKTMGRGTGLGLAMVYGIVKGHRGAIQVYSEPGHGTTFHIYLPASAKEADMDIASEESIVKGKGTILLVDDEASILTVAKEMLEALGYRVYAAGSGQEGIAVYREKRREIDLVILDMIMTGISGGKTFDHLREIDPAVRVLLSSGYSINGEAQEILDRGCNGFLQKPFHLEKLSGKIREILC